MTRRPRIGIHCPGIGAGGPWRYVHSLLKSIDLSEFEVILLSDLAGEYTLRPGVISVGWTQQAVAPATAEPMSATPKHRTVRHGWRFRNLVGVQGRVALGFYRAAQRFAERLRPLQLDLFHTQCTGCEEAPYAAKLAGVPRIVGTFHTDWTTDLRQERSGPGYRFLETVSNRSLHRGIAVSQSAARNWLRRTALPAGRVVTILHGIDAGAFISLPSPAAARQRFNIPADAFVVAAVGRLDEVKGLADLIEAAAIVLPKVPKLKLLLAGDGPLKASLEFLAFQKGLADVVCFAGYVPNVADAHAAADVLAMPSLSETFGFAACEAMAVGKPVIASKIGGLPELIAHGVTGLLVPPKSPTELANAIVLLATEPELRTRFGDAGRERVRTQFTEERMTRQTFDVYRQLLEGRG